MTAMGVSRFGCDMSFLRGNGDKDPDQRAAAGAILEFDMAADQFRPFSHGNEPEAGVALLAKAFTVILNLHGHSLRGAGKPYFGLLRTGMACNVVQRFLQDAIEVGGRFARYLPLAARLRIPDGNAGT